MEILVQKQQFVFLQRNKRKIDHFLIEK